MKLATIERPAILEAIAEFDRLGREAFLQAHGFRPSARFHLRHERRLYDSKAILGVAYGYQHRVPALRPAEFSGGAATAERIFTRAGFAVLHGERDGGKVAPRPRRRFGKTAAGALAAVLLVGLVACTKTKGPAAAPARDLYTSWGFQRSREVVERECHTWAVLSARHGVVGADETIAPYDQTLPRKAPTGWVAKVRAQLRARWGDRPVCFMALAGANYCEPLQGLPHCEPLQGLGTGKRRAWLRRRTSGVAS